MNNDAGPVGPDSSDHPEQAEIALTPKSFWSIFYAALFIYGGLYVSSSVMEGKGWVAGMTGGFGAMLAPGIPAFVLASRRQRFLRLRGSIPRFIAHKALSGLGFALVAGAVSTVYYPLTGTTLPEGFGGRPVTVFLVWTLNGLFLYTLLLGFLMWADSMDRAQESRALAAREAVLRTQAEAKALRAQFSPHFVFNALHSLMLLVRADPARAERAIEDVAALIRYASTLQRRQVDRVPLSKELEFARRYIALEKLRLEERLSVEWAIEEGLEDVFVPAYSLQTLLENSIKHGIAPKPEGGAVIIRATADADNIQLSVEDDGLGAEQDQIGTNGGSGLQLLRSRLESVYGGDASIRWRTSLGGGFACDVRVPISRGKVGEKLE